jgi:tRNA threonylcarbamoyladenosine biosynthesis protein TsaB
MILVLDTSKEECFIGLWDVTRNEWASKEQFIGARELNSLILQRLDKVLSYSQEYQSTLGGIIVAAGPGSFTGLRIGISVANTLAYALNIPIVAPEGNNTEQELLQIGLKMLESSGSQFDLAVIPHYGADPHITKPKD